MHRSALGDLLIDAAPDVHDRELEFWQRATGASLRPLGDAGAHTRLKGRWSAVALLATVGGRALFDTLHLGDGNVLEIGLPRDYALYALTAKVAAALLFVLFAFPA